MDLKKHISLILLLLTAFSANAQITFPPSSPREVRAVWLTTIGGLDWPKEYASTDDGIERQKKELCEQLDRLHKLGINTVLLQTRVRGTVIYPSDIEPWDGCLSGRPGVSPGYDALAFAVDECHKRGMTIQAWVVAFPLMNMKVARQLGKQSLPSRRPELCRKAGNQWMMDPGVPGTDDYLANLCAEIVSKYDVDGIHLDYIRYPEHSIPFNDKSTYRRYGKGMERNEWRRSNITRCVSKIHSAIKKLKPWVVLSCSPIGKHDDLPMFSSYGWNARTAVAQDVQAWMKMGIMDEIFPMMYFKENHFFPFALDWVEDCGGRIVAPGLGVYLLAPEEKDWELETITRQLSFLRIIRACGQAYFRSKFVLDNEKGIADYLHDFFYYSPALTPALKWEDSIAPEKPGNITIDKGKYEWRIAWDASHDPTPGTGVRYNIYCSSTYPVEIGKDAELMATYLERPEYTLDMSSPYDRSTFYAVTAIDRFGNESEPAGINTPCVINKKEAELEVENGNVHLPGLDAKLIIVTDGEGREISITQYDTLLQVKTFTPGLYKVYSQGKRGGPHRVGTFLVK